MSKDISKKQIEQNTQDISLLEEEIDVLASKFQDIITSIASKKSIETLLTVQSANKSVKQDSQAIKSEIIKQLRSFNERAQNKFDALQQRYEQDIQNQQLKYRNLEEQLKQQQEDMSNSQSYEKNIGEFISQREMKVRSDLIKRYEALNKQTKGLIEDNEILRNKKHELKKEITIKDQMVDNLNQRIEQISNQYKRSVEKITKNDQIIDDLNKKIEQITDINNESVAENNKKDRMIDNLNQKIEQMSNNYNGYIEKVTIEKKKQKDKFKEQFSKAKTEIAQLKDVQANLNELIKELTKNIKSVTTENDALKVEAEATKSNLKKILDEKTNNEKKLNLLKNEIQNLKSALNTTESEKKNLKAEYNALKVENENNKSNLKKLLEEKTNNDKMINLLKEEKQNLQQNVDKITANLTENNNLISKQKDQINELQAKQKETIEKFTKSQKEMEQKNKQELQKIKNTLDESQDTIKNQSQKLVKNEEIISNLLKIKEEKERDIKDLQKKHTDLTEKYTKLKNDSHTEIEKLKAENLQFQETNNAMKQKIIDFEIAENNRNIVKQIFNKQIFTDNDIQHYPEEEVFIPQEYSQELIQVIDDYEELIPTIIFHFDKPPSEFDYDYFDQILKESSNGEAVIIDVKKGSTIIKVAIASFIQSEKEIKNKLGKIVNCVKELLNSSIEGKSIIGNLIEEPEIKITNDKKIKEICTKPSLNLFQNTQELNDKINVEQIKKDVIKYTREKKETKCNWKYIFSHETLYEQLEKQVRTDLNDNHFEMTIVAQTVIANKFLDNEYEKIKKKIPSCDIKECFLYHGSRLKNHQKIIKKHFLMPGQDKMEQVLDDGYYGKGVYATENIFYASKYSNGYNTLKVNEKAYVLCCLAVYNKKMVKELYDLSYYGKKIDDNIKNNYGINHAFVGDCVHFRPIKESDKEKCNIYGQEFVFSNKYQLIPLCSFTIMRKDHCIIWKDEHIENNENSSYMKELSKKMEINVYYKKSVDDAIEMIKKKKRSKIKLITNGGSDLSGKKLIEKARQIIGSNFVCLVFASSPDHIKWVSEMENVLFTKCPADFRAFSELKMEKKCIINFAHGLEEKNKYKFKINEKELLKFPSVII